ncbi:MAG: peptidoglycan-binding domain-containing protein [bacterium]
MRFKIFLIFFAVFLIPLPAQATEGEFNVDPSYDYLARSKVSAFLYQIGENAYFYVEEGYYNNLDIDKKKEFSEAIKNLSQEFDNKIYPKLKEVFGSEPNPGIDKDPRLIVLITQIKGEAGGYFNSGDEYPKAQSPDSNEREMLYLNATYIASPLVKSYLAHEFTHLIIFNQKNNLHNVEEEVWLNEARAEAAVSLLGYDLNYQGSNLQKRVRTFSQNPTDPLTEWKNLAPDYGVANIFVQYLLDHYDVKILSDSLHSDKIGIASLDEVLQRSGSVKNFAQIFTDWSIAVLVNDCSLGREYCYLNPNLQNLRILPKLNYLPLSDESVLTVIDYTKNWAGNWIKFIGGRGTLKLEFVGETGEKFNVPYLTKNFYGNYSISFFNLDNNQRGIVYLPGFGRDYESLVIVPSLQKKTAGFDGLESFHKFIWSTSLTNEETPQKEQEAKLIQQLLSQIESLKKEIAIAQAKISAILLARQKPVSPNSGLACPAFSQDLYFGLADNSEVRCLQKFLLNQGPEIYPEGLITGNFGALTKAALIRFQKKNSIPGTGYFGPLTRQLLNSSD